MTTVSQRMHGKWSEAGVPHRGWVCVDWHDLEEPSAICQMCETQTIRYVHVMRHADYPDELRVGCECAAKMEEDREAAYTREKNSKSLGQRKARWLKRKWDVTLLQDVGHYNVLGVAHWADQDALKKAYRSLALRYHPDRNFGDAASAEKFKHIANAYAALSDPQKRAEYDKTGGGRLRMCSANVNHFGIVLHEGRPDWTITITDRSCYPWDTKKSRFKYPTMESAIAGAFIALIYMEGRRKKRNSKIPS